MGNSDLPHFRIKNRFQKKKELYSDILTKDILSDVCLKITGSRDFTCEFDDIGYNVGRMAVLEYEGVIAYISFSETSAKGRNSSFQSVPSALSRYILEENESKRICFYFLPSTGNIQTSYFIFMYRLMATVGIEFLNDVEFLSQRIQPFSTITDIINSRDMNRGRNPSNNSTYLTQGSGGEVQIFGKTYGASKYETTLLSVAAWHLTSVQIELYQIIEHGLTVLPKSSKQAIESLGRIKLIASDLRLERSEFIHKDSLRSPLFTYNLLAKLGAKKCSLCECEIPELIQGAHIWPVAEIKKKRGVNIEEKIRWATDGDNGIWMCENHHKMLDANLIVIDEEGHVSYKKDLEEANRRYLKGITPRMKLASSILNTTFIDYLQKRNASIDFQIYDRISVIIL
jgi:hypothetical protein